MLTKPVLAKRSDISKVAPENLISGNPKEWFKTSYFLNEGIYSTTFDFFVDWPNKKIGNEVWLKRILAYNDRITNYHQLEQEIAECDGKIYSRETYSLLKYYGLIEKYMIFRDVKESRWDKREETIPSYDISERNGDASLKNISVDELEEQIRLNRKAAPGIGAHGLIYSISGLEGHLSDKAYIWPGDVDTVLYSPVNNYKVNAVLEFKKHTASSHIDFYDEKLSNYVNRDRLKYESLGLLRDFFDTTLYVIFFPVETKYKNVYIEKIGGSYDALVTDKRYKIPIPVKNFEQSLSNFADAF